MVSPERLYAYLDCTLNCTERTCEKCYHLHPGFGCPTNFDSDVHEFLSNIVNMMKINMDSDRESRKDNEILQEIIDVFKDLSNGGM